MSGNVKKTIKFLTLDTEQPIVGFIEGNESFEIGKNVMQKYDFTKYPIKKNDKVEVAFEDDSIVFLRKVGGEKNVDNPPETKKDESSFVEKTINAISLRYDGAINFMGEDGVWCKLTKTTIGKDLVGEEIVAKDRVKVNMSERLNKKDPSKKIIEIVEIVKIESGENSKTDSQDEGKKQTSSTNSSSYHNSTQASIEAQVSINNATVLIEKIIEKEGFVLEKRDVIIELFNDFARNGYNIMQKLKKGE